MTIFADRRNARDSYLLFLYSDVSCLRRFGCVGKEKEAKDGDRDGNNTVFEIESLAFGLHEIGKMAIHRTNQEYPLPASEASHSGHAFVYGCHHDTSKHRSHLT